MRTLLALTIFAFAACGGTQPKKEGAIVTEGDTPPTCCCKTLPKTAEKEIVPSYTNQGRMECSAANGDCVDDVQCAGQPPAETGTDTAPSGAGADGVPPPPTLEPSNP
jgi:hypothetical protein